MKFPNIKTKVGYSPIGKLWRIETLDGKVICNVPYDSITVSKKDGFEIANFISACFHAGYTETLLYGIVPASSPNTKNYEKPEKPYFLT